jgi:hypothetical protein
MRLLLVLAAVAVIVGVIVVLACRLIRRDPPGYYDAKPPHPGFRRNRGRGRDR